MPGGSDRSLARIEVADLLRLAALAAEAVVLIDPQNRAGEIVWPAASHAS